MSKMKCNAINEARRVTKAKGRVHSNSKENEARV